VGDLSPEEMVITGVQVNYFLVCKTKLWFFSRHATMEQESDLVSLGRLIHDGSYTKSKRGEVKIGRISIDFIVKGDTLIIHEVKKSDKLEKAHKYQLLYYLYYLKRRGIKAKGIIDYPSSRRRVKLELSEEDESEIERILNGVKEIISMENPPKPERKPYCRKCSYFELCWVS